MKGLSKEANATLLALAAVTAAPYTALALEIAAACGNVVTSVNLAKAKKVTVWGLFKEAISIGIEQGQDAAAMRTGLELACVQAAVPAGTLRGYASTVQSLAADVLAGELSAEDVNEISVKDARGRYQDLKAKTLSDARKALSAAVKDYTAKQIEALVADVEACKADAMPEAERLAA